MRMRPFLARFSEPVWSGHSASWADSITTTPELEFSIHTAVVGRRSGRQKRARLNCINHLLTQFPYQEIQRDAVVLPPRVRNPDYYRGTFSRRCTSRRSTDT